MVSQKKTAANRRNAKLSKGPKDTSVTRFNALKHGTLSGQALIRTGEGKEDPKEFQRFSDAIREDLAPFGATEELMVEDLIGLWWR